jgi:Zyg-11 protein homolog
LDTVLSCLECWSDKKDLVRNMLGLIGNVAEVKELRPYLITAVLMEQFR